MEKQSHKYPELRLSFVMSTALLLQTAVALIWIGAATERLAQLEEKAEGLEAVSERTVRLEEQGAYMRASLDRIEFTLSKSMAE